MSAVDAYVVSKHLTHMADDAIHTGDGIRHNKWMVITIVGGLLLLWGIWYAFAVIRYVFRGEFTFV
jgi:hypothetical protein